MDATNTQNTTTTKSTSLAQRASARREQLTEKRAEARQASNEHFKRQYDDLVTYLQEYLTGDSVAETINESVELGHDSVRVMTFYFPLGRGLTVEGEIDGVLYDSLPVNETYWSCESDDPGQGGRPIVTFFNGVRNRRTGQNDITRLPYGKTVQQTLTEWISTLPEDNILRECTLTVQPGRDNSFTTTNQSGHTRRGVPTLNMLLIWDMDKYSERQERYEAERKRRSMARRQRQTEGRRTQTVQEYNDSLQSKIATSLLESN